MQDPKALYILVRADLPPGLQMAQAVHAAVTETLRNTVLARTIGNTIVLSVPDEETLLARAAGSLFREPDLNGEATASAAFTDGREYSDLPLAGRAMA